MITWDFWVDSWEHPFSSWFRGQSFPAFVALESIEEVEVYFPPVPKPGPPVPGAVEPKPKPTSKPPEDSFGWMSAGEITQWWTPQGGSVTTVPSVGPDYWFMPENMPSDAEIIEMGVKYILMRSPLPTIPSWMLVEPEPTYA